MRKKTQWTVSRAFADFIISAVGQGQRPYGQMKNEE